MSALADTVYRVGVIADQTWRAAGRQRAVAVLAILAVASVAGALGLTALNFGESELRFLADVGFGAMTVFGAGLTIVATSQLFFAEIEHRTALTLLAKPVRRSEFVAGQYLGGLVLAGAFCLGLTLLLAAVLWSRERTLGDALGAPVRIVNYAAVAAVGFALWLKLAVLSAATLLVATFARTQLYAATLGFLILVICQLQYLAQAAALRSGGTVARGAAGLLGWVFPDFRLFDLGEALGRGAPLAWMDLGAVTLYAAAYAAIVCSLAAWSFSHREL